MSEAGQIQRLVAKMAAANLESKSFLRKRVEGTCMMLSHADAGLQMLCELEDVELLVAYALGSVAWGAELDGAITRVEAVLLGGT
jgi:hypothetical protein